MLDEMLTDEELTALALAADADAPMADDAVSLWELTGDREGELLPAWYMPAPMAAGAGSRPAWLRWVVAVIVASFLSINAYGLCSTYGEVGFH